MKYNTTHDADFSLRDDVGQPSVKHMADALQQAASDAHGEIEDQLLADDSRYCYWPDQDETGRKPALVNGQPASPWPNASDVRVRLADGIINDDVKVCKHACRRGQLTVRGTESGDMRDGGKISLYLDHLRKTKMKRQTQREAGIAANYRQTYGKCLTAVTWHQEWAVDYKEITLEQLVEEARAEAQKGQPGVASQLLNAMSETTRDGRREVVALLKAWFPALDNAAAHEQARELELNGRMSLPRRYLRRNEPRREALKLWRDVWLPVNTEDHQDSPWIAWRRTFTPAQVKEKVISEKWDEAFVEAVLKTTGRTIVELTETDQNNINRRTDWRDSAEDMEGRIEIFYFYHTVPDESGAPCKHLTVMSPHIMGHAEFGRDEAPVGLDEPLDYDHGEYPFVAHRREDVDRQFVASRVSRSSCVSTSRR